MATKGPSNRYGNTRGSRKGRPTIHTGFAWAKGFYKTTIKAHFNNHGSQVSATTPTAYMAKAVKFANKIDRVNHVSYVRKNGTTVKYSKTTNEFAVIDKNGYVRTYYKPRDGIKEYYKDRRKHR